MAARGVKFAWILVVPIAWALSGNAGLAADEPPDDAGEAIVASTSAAPKSVMSVPVTPALVSVPDGAGVSEVSDASGGPDDCQNVMSRGDGCCGPAGRYWMQADYLLWWTKGAHLPPLVTTSGTGDDPSGLPPGSLGRTDTTLLFGGSTVEDRDRSGAEITLGMWLNGCNTWGIEGNYLDLGRLTAGYDSGVSNGYPALFRPFFDTSLGTNNAEEVSIPGLLAGRMIASASDYFQSAGLHFRHNLCCWESCDGAADCGELGCHGACDCNACCRRAFRLDVIGGYRYYNLADNVSVQEQLVTLTSAAPTGTQINVADSFRTRSSFNGTELGLIADYYYGRWSLELSAKMSLGWNHDIVNINGSTAVIGPDGTTNTYSGGVLALYQNYDGVPLNMGSYSRDTFVVIPEFGVQVGYQFTERLRGFFGYDFLYWAQVARAADQINLNVDPNNWPPPVSGGGTNPTFSFNTASFWAQGIRLGAEYRF